MQSEENIFRKRNEEERLRGKPPSGEDRVKCRAQKDVFVNNEGNGGDRTDIEIIVFQIQREENISRKRAKKEH